MCNVGSGSGCGYKCGCGREEKVKKSKKSNWMNSKDETLTG